MIDLHCHILPEIDDGPDNIEESVAMSRMAAEDGITHVVATPHFSYGGNPGIDDIRQCFDKFDRRLAEEHIPLRLMRGADIRLTFELLRGIENKDIPTINNSRYFLLELPDILPPNTPAVVNSARNKGLIPIITHPERNYALQSSPGKIGNLRDAGAFFQLTAMSITGEFGNEIQQLSYFFLKKGFADFVASDAHGTNGRVPVLSRAYRAVARFMDDEKAGMLFFRNPSAVIADSEIIVV